MLCFLSHGLRSPNLVEGTIINLFTNHQTGNYKLHPSINFHTTEKSPHSSLPSKLQKATPAKLTEKLLKIELNWCEISLSTYPELAFRHRRIQFITLQTDQKCETRIPLDEETCISPHIIPKEDYILHCVSHQSTRK